MGTFSKIILSGSTKALPLPITSIGASDAANLIHKGITGGVPSAFDEVYIYAFNSATADRLLALRWGASGGAGATTLIGRNQYFTVPAQDGDYLISPGHMMGGGNAVYGFGTVAGSVTGALVVHGWVNRFST